jgi:hypothetical protein
MILTPSQTFKGRRQIVWQDELELESMNSGREQRRTSIAKKEVFLLEVRLVGLEYPPPDVAVDAAPLRPSDL